MKPVFAFFEVAVRLSSSRTSWQRSMHWSQMYTPGPATSLRTWSWPLSQKEQRVWRLRSSLSFTRGPQPLPLLLRRFSRRLAGLGVEGLGLLELLDHGLHDRFGLLV